MYHRFAIHRSSGGFFDYVWADSIRQAKAEIRRRYPHTRYALLDQTACPGLVARGPSYLTPEFWEKRSG
ncbi:hypothetical protein FG147_02860 [Thauera sp. UPWRP]|nr:hypothetical protein FG147_02860 [Thauera sp. UPWRP]